MRWFASLFIIIYCALPLLAEEGPRLAVMEMTATGDYPDAALRTQLTQELRQRIANKQLFAVLDGPPQQERLVALPDNAPFADRHDCLVADCLPRIGEALTVKAVLWVTADCGSHSCFVSAVLTPTSGGRPTVMMSETPRDEQGLRAAISAVAGKLGPPPPPPTFAVQKPETLTTPQNTATLSDEESPKKTRVAYTGRDKLTYQNYIFTLRVFAGLTLGAGITWGTLRWKNFQMEVLHVQGGVDSLSPTRSMHLTEYWVGLGGKWPLSSSDGHEELGFMIGVLGAGVTISDKIARIELLPTRFIYRYNMDSGGVFEAGIAMPLIWFIGNTAIPNITLYVGIGY